MKFLFRFLRCAAFMAMMMAWIMPARAQHPFTLTTASDITNGTQHYYLIQSFDRITFYAIPHSDAEDSKVSTTSIPNATMRWCFVDAGSDDENQYYYIVNSTGRCLYRMNDDNDGIRIKNTYADLAGLSDDELNKYKFYLEQTNPYLEQTNPYYFIHPKGSNLYLNKRGTNPNYANSYYIKASTYSDSPSVWNFVAVDDVTWPQPFTVSTIADKHYYKFQNVTNTSFYLSNSEEWATMSSTDNNDNIWYLLDAGMDATYSGCHYYYVKNASTEKYLYYTGGTGDDVAKIMDYNSTEDDKYCFLIVDAAYKPDNTSYVTCYTIVPKLRQAYFSGKDSFAPMAMSDDSHLLLKNERGSGNNDSHWFIVPTEYFPVENPAITNNFDGTITLSTATPNADIYYTLDGSDPDNTSTVYSAPFSLGDATVIKAIAYLGSDFSAVSTYNVPQYTTPTIAFNSITSEVTVTCTDAAGIYYTTNGSTPTTSSTPYSAPFTVSSGTTVKAIATHRGYLNSDVAIKYIQGSDYPSNYLTFNVLSAGAIAWKAIGTGMEKEIYYRINGGSWTSITSTSDGATIDVNEGDVVEFKGSNTAYAKDKNNYSGFDGGTASFNISGNIMSLIYGDNFVGQTTLTGTYNFCSLFKQSKCISAEHLILPATTLTADCYRAMFSMCETLRNAPALPATTLAKECYWYMFECCAITTAPDLLAPTLVTSCYAHMFVGCSNLNYIKCLATSGINTTNLDKWVGKKNAETTIGVAATGTFIKDDNVTSWSEGVSGIPTGWSLLAAPVINCDGEYITMTCDTEGASIYYRLNQTGDFSQYTSSIAFNSNTTVEAYSQKGSNTSNTIIVTFEKYDTPYDESNRSLDSWTYGGTQVTLPYSVNGIDGHSSSYSKGTHTFETTITLYELQPTYLWFQHADQSADIYVDNAYVTTHWGGYNAFFVDITEHVHVGTNNIKVILNNTTRNTLAPSAGDFNFNATLGKAKLFTSPVVPSMDYGYDGMHITSTVTAASATIKIKTSIPVGASVVCKIDADDENYHYTETKASTGGEITFTTTISNPRLWNGTEDPFLYDITLEIYKDSELYHKYERPYGFRYYGYNTTTGFLLNGSPYLLRGVCMHHDLEGKANALTDEDIANDFALIQDLGCNFIRLAHYPHPKEVYDWCDRLGIIVQTEVPCVNKFQSTMPQDYYDHLYIQYEDMVRQHYNHPCIMFWGLFNEATTDDTSIAKTRLEAYRAQIKSLDPERWVGYVVSHSSSNPSSLMGNPDMDWFGCNLYVGWYIDQNSNNPTSHLNTRKTNIITNLHKPLALSEYGCGGTRHCHSDEFMTTTTRGNNPRHDIEYQMWLHEGYIAAIKNFPELLFTAQWQLFDIAVSSRQEGYKVCFDGGENVFDNDELKYLNNKGLVERDHKTKKDTYYLYKAWWNQTDKFVHICGKDYKKLTDRAIKCYTNDGSSLSLYMNNSSEPVETVTVTNNIATFTARSFNAGDVIRVEGATSNDTFTFTGFSNDNVFTTTGDWNVAANWNGNAVPADGSDVVIMADATVPSGQTVNAGNIDLFYGTLTITDGGQLYHNNEGVNATVEKNISAYTVIQNQGALLSNGWYFISSPITDDYMPAGSMVENDYDLYRLNNTTWENYKNTTEHPDFTTLNNGVGYLYANSEDVTLKFTGALKPSATSESVSVSAGWNLIGNPFAYNVYADRSYYKMNEAMTGVVAVSSFSTSPIAPCTGIVVEAETTGNVIFSKDAPTQSQGGNGSLQITLNQAGTRDSDPMDNAIVSFNEGAELGKFYFGRQNANIYIPQNGDEYAIAFSNRQANISLNFEATETGAYTISFEGEDIDLNGIYLIDLLAGQEIDLSVNPSYTFIGSSADRAERFVIVFNENNNENFAYQNGNDIIVNGEGELQIFDVTGRSVMTTTISGMETVHVPATGVYIFRLIGSDIKTQKIMIR